MLHVFALNNVKTALAFTLPSNPEIIVEYDENIVDELFEGLSLLYLTDSCSFTSSSIMGLLLGSDYSSTAEVLSCACFPISALSTMCNNCFTTAQLLAFLKVCRCYYPNLRVYDRDSNGNKAAAAENVELPASTIWSLLIFAEVFGVKRVHREVTIKIATMLKIEPNGHCRLPLTISGCFGEDELKQIEPIFGQYFSNLHRSQRLNRGIPNSNPIGQGQPHDVSQWRDSTESRIVSQTIEDDTDSSLSSFSSERYRTQSSFPSHEHTCQRNGTQWKNSCNMISASNYKVDEKDEEFTVDENSTDYDSYSGVGGTTYDNSMWQHAAVYNSSEKYRTVESLFISNNHKDKTNPETGRTFPKSDSIRAKSPAKAPFGSSSARSTTPTTSTQELLLQSTERKKGILSPEELRLSREIAKLRLQEVKVREELESSRQKAERELRESRLVALRLHADLARSSATKSAPSKAENLRKAPNLTGPMTHVNSKTTELHVREFVTAEEARQRAAQRVREARKAMERKELEGKQLKLASEEKKWRARDEKIARFKELQERKILSNSSNMDNKLGTSEELLFGNAPTSTATGKKNITLTNFVPFQPIAEGSSGQLKKNQSDDDPVQQASDRIPVYSKEALEAVGMGYSPTNYVTPIKEAPARSNISKQKDSPASVAVESWTPEGNEVSKQHQQMSIPPSPTSDMISVRVVRAWGLVETLGGTNPYVVLDWGRYGRAATQAIQATTEPHFGSTLQFKSPYRAIQDHINIDPTLAEYPILQHDSDKLISSAGPLKVLVHSRNASVSDELIATGEIDANEAIAQSSNHPYICYLTDSKFQPAGCLEVVLKLIRS